MLSPEDARKLKTLPEWRALEEHISDAVVALDSCSTVPDGADYAVEALARKRAVETLIKILEPFACDPKPLTDKRVEALRRIGMLD